MIRVIEGSSSLRLLHCVLNDDGRRLSLQGRVSDYREVDNSPLVPPYKGGRFSR